MLNRNLRRVCLLVAVSFGLSLAAAQEPLNLSVAKAAVIRYVESGEYDRDLALVAERACTWIEERAAEQKPAERLGLVLDIDETALSNLGHMREMDFGYVPALWDQWVAEGNAPAIMAVGKIYQAARQSNVTVFFITGRKVSDRPGTEKNLAAVGMSDYQQLLCKPNGSLLDTRSFKTRMRQNLEAEGWTLIANVGDQDSDLSGGAAERTFKLPNPFYMIQ
ncbi:MAG: HAD family acid phosphatase [Cephaloticoccus sp.]|nr:HAD family acid phosphatase [Cephaloticoccus sp.]MCF7759042.1 HAD family acid phosphatase [Cephaloticoccus sp.]